MDSGVITAGPIIQPGGPKSLKLDPAQYEQFTKDQRVIIIRHFLLCVSYKYILIEPLHTFINLQYSHVNLSHNFNMTIT